MISTPPNPQMVTEVNHRLRSWCLDTKRDREREIRQLLSGLTFLIFFIPNPYLTRVLLEFRDPVRMIFKFTDCDLTRTIEEISDFIDLSYHECEMMVPYNPSSREFLKSIGMKSNPIFTSFDLGWTHLDFLYSPCNRDNSYYNFSDEFECSIEECEKYRLDAFAIALLEYFFSLKQGGKSTHV